MKNKIPIVLILLFVNCSVPKSDDQLFDEFYKNAAEKFADCINFGLNRLNQPLGIEDCERMLKPEIDRQFNQNGINSDGGILGATLTASTIDSSAECRYSKRFVGHYDKPLFDKEIYGAVSKIDTTISLKNDTLYYSADIRKTMIFFNCKNKYFELQMDIKIPENIDIAALNNISGYHRGKTNALLNNISVNHK